MKKLDSNAIILYIYHQIINDEQRYYEFIAEYEGFYFLCNMHFEILDTGTLSYLIDTHGIQKDFLTKL